MVKGAVQAETLAPQHASSDLSDNGIAIPCPFILFERLSSHIRQAAREFCDFWGKTAIEKGKERERPLVTTYCAGTRPISASAAEVWLPLSRALVEAHGEHGRAREEGAAAHPQLSCPPADGDMDRRADRRIRRLLFRNCRAL
jgi:hypothetical protein